MMSQGNDQNGGILSEPSLESPTSVDAIHLANRDSDVESSNDSTTDNNLIIDTKSDISSSSKPDPIDYNTQASLANENQAPKEKVNKVTNESDDAASKSDQDEASGQSRELKLLLALSKEANLEINLSRKRKSLGSKRRPEYRNSPGKGKIQYPVTAESELEMDLTHDETKSETKSDDGIVTGVKVKAMKRKSPSDSMEGAVDETKKRKSLSGDIVIFKLDKDTFCWRCHKDSVNISCETCVRSYHHRCLKQTIQDPNHWPCPECVSILKAESTQTRSTALKGMTLEHLCSLLKFAVNRMIQCQGSEPFIHAVNDVEFPDYKKYIIQPMDLTLLEKNIKENHYGSTQAFEADAKWILHNSIVFNSYHSKLTSVAKFIMKICKQEMSEIENCPTCYLNANTKKNTWFVEVCPKPHLLVWAKLRGFPYWPGKAMSCKDGMVDVRFFGAHDRAWVPEKECFLYSPKDPNSFRVKRADIEQCVEELNVHVQNLKKVFGEFHYPNFKTPIDPHNETGQIQLFLPEYKTITTKSKTLKRWSIDKHQEESLPEEKSEKQKDNLNDSKGSGTPNEDEAMEGYGTDDEELPHINTEMRINMLKKTESDSDKHEADEDDTQVPSNIEPDKTGAYEYILTKGALKSFPGEIQSKDSLDSSNLNTRLSLDDGCQHSKKSIRKDSDAKSESPRALDKISHVDISENVEISLGNDEKGSVGYSENISSSSSECSSDFSVELKKRPVQVDVDNAEFTISPASKLKMSDKLIQRLSDKEDSSGDNVSRSEISSDALHNVKKNLNNDKLPHTTKLIEKLKEMVQPTEPNIDSELSENDDPVSSTDEPNVDFVNEVEVSEATQNNIDPSELKSTLTSPPSLQPEEDNEPEKNKTEEESKCVDNSPANDDIPGDEKATDETKDTSALSLKENENFSEPPHQEKIQESNKGEAVSNDDDKMYAIDEDRNKTNTIYMEEDEDDEIDGEENNATDPLDDDQLTIDKEKIINIIHSSLSDNSNSPTKSTSEELKILQKENNANAAKRKLDSSSSSERSIKITENIIVKNGNKENQQRYEHSLLMKTLQAKRISRSGSIQNSPSSSTRSSIHEVPPEDFKSEPESESDTPSGQDMEAKKKYLSALNILEKSEASLKPKPNEIRTRSKTEEKREQCRIIDNMTKIIEDVAVNFSASHDTQDKKKTTVDTLAITSSTSVSKPDNCEIFVKSFAKIGSNTETAEAPNRTLIPSPALKHRARKSFPQPNYNKPVLKPQNPNVKEPPKLIQSTVASTFKIDSPKIIITTSSTATPVTTTVSSITTIATSQSTKLTVPPLNQLDGVRPTNGYLILQQPQQENLLLIPPNPTLSYTNNLGNQIVSMTPCLVSAPTNANNTRHLSRTPTIWTPTPAQIQFKQSLNLNNSQNYIPQEERSRMKENQPGTSTIVVTTCTGTPTIIPTVAADGNITAKSKKPVNGNSDNANEITGPLENERIVVDPEVVESNETDEFAVLNNLGRDNISKAITELVRRPPPKLKPRPPGILSQQFSEGLPSSAGPITTKINSIAHRMTDYFRGMMIETMEDLNKANNPEATIASLKLEIETLKHQHNIEIAEIEKNMCTVLKDIQRSIVEDREKIIDETRAAHEAETIKRIEEAKSKQWCANCAKEAQFYCCWNTSYCDYPCQQKHWPTHMSKCTQNVNQSSQNVPTATLRPNSQQLILRPAQPPPKGGIGRVLTKPLQKVYVNRNMGTTKAMRVKVPTTNYLTMMETTPGNFQLMGNQILRTGSSSSNMTAANIISIATPATITSTSNLNKKNNAPKKNVKILPATTIDDDDD